LVFPLSGTKARFYLEAKSLKGRNFNDMGKRENCLRFIFQEAGANISKNNLLYLFVFGSLKKHNSAVNPIGLK